MRKEATEFNNSVEDIGDAISGTAISAISLASVIISVPWLIVRVATEESSGLIDEIVK